MHRYTETLGKHMGEVSSMGRQWLTDGDATFMVDGVAPTVGVDSE
jgi:hypothetical protein